MEPSFGLSSAAPPDPDLATVPQDGTLAIGPRVALPQSAFSIRLIFAVGRNPNTAPAGIATAAKPSSQNAPRTTRAARVMAKSRRVWVW